MNGAKRGAVAARDSVLLLAAGALLLASGCGGDIGGTGPTGPPAITAEQQAIANALANAGILAGAVGGFNILALSQVAERQQLNGFETFAIQVAWELLGSGGGEQGPDVGWFTGIVGWSGLNVAAETVDEAFTVGLEGEGLTVVTTGTGQVGQHTGGFGTIALYVERMNNAFYVGKSGTITIDDGAFDTPGSCATEGGVDLGDACTVAIGTMGGTFDFDADLRSGTGSPTYSQPQTAFDLPAIRVQVTDQ